LCKLSQTYRAASRLGFEIRPPRGFMRRNSQSEAHDPGGTKERIQHVALELFVLHGYEKTSLREIADRLGVTKAALYYYYKTKDDIVVSCVEDYLAELDEVLAWGRIQPRTDETRREIIRRYAEVVLHRQAAMRFFQQNPSTERITIGSEFKNRMVELRGLLVDPDGPLTQHIRALAAIASLHLASAVFQDDQYTPAQVCDAALAVSRELVSADHRSNPTEPPAQGPIDKADKADRAHQTT